MQISKIHLSNFRSFKDKILDFSPQITIIVGPNATGKSNILEALFFLSSGKSFRARIEEEMVNYEDEIARIKGKVKIDNTDIILEAILTRGFLDIGKTAPEKIVRKKLLVNGVSRRLIDFAGNLRVTLFGPWDLELVTQSPSLRRKFLDSVLFQVDREYRRASLSYDKGLRQRNKLLFRIREEGISRSQLLFWDKLLIKNGDYISRAREELINYINNMPSLDDQDFYLEYDKSAISENRLNEYAEEEIAAAITLVGPHRDDLVFKAKDGGDNKERDLAKYGSRGEQRMAILWLKLAELSFIESKTDERPTLLLDDIFSELDHNHREIVIKAALNQQTIITTADPHFIEGMGKVKLIKL
jgi:DNA replication and repair protein RecF